MPAESKALLDATGGLDPLADLRRRLTETVVGELLVLNSRDLDVDVDAVEQGTGDALLVAGDHGLGGRCTLSRVSRVAARGMGFEHRST